ncbi:MAG: hypothetical protein U0807_17315 [Candidatus Binatia bacterium]
MSRRAREDLAAESVAGGAPHGSGAAASEQEKVLADITHEVGNFFHRLYYWSEYLQAPRGHDPIDASAGEMLHATIRGLEGFLRRALEYFHPLELTRTSMGVGEILRALAVQVRGQASGAPLEVADLDGWSDAAVLVDPGRFTMAAQAVARHLADHLAADSTIAIRLGRHARTVAIEFIVHRARASSQQAATSGLEWALAERIVQLHGGQLRDEPLVHHTKTVTLELPLAAG